MSKTSGFQACGVLEKQPHGIGSLAHQTEVLVDDIEMVERVVITDDSAKVRTESPDHAIRLTPLFRERASEYSAGEISGIEPVLTAIRSPWLQGAGPGVIAHAVDQLLALPAPCFRQSLRKQRVEACHAAGVSE